MKNSNSKRTIVALVVTAGIFATSQVALAHGKNISNGARGSEMMDGQYGPGMMGGQYGPGMMGGQYGPGMMGGQYGPGMMGGQYGPGMMGGQYGPGMMGSQYSHGIMGANNLFSIDDESGIRINTELDNLRLKSWEINGLALKEAPVLREALSKELPDPVAVGAIYSRLFDLKRQLLEAQLSTRNTINRIVKNATKTEEQKN